VALGFTCEGIDALGELTRLPDVRAVATNAVHDHDHALVERTDGERAVSMGEMMRDRYYIFRLRQIQRSLCRLFSFSIIHVALIDQANFQLLDRQDVAIAHHQIDIVERNALSLQTIVDDFLEKPTSMLLARYPLLLDRIGNLAIAQQAR